MDRLTFSYGISGSFEEDTELPEGLKDWNKDKSDEEGPKEKATVS